MAIAIVVVHIPIALATAVAIVAIVVAIAVAVATVAVVVYTYKLWSIVYFYCSRCLLHYLLGVLGWLFVAAEEVCPWVLCVLVVAALVPLLVALVAAVAVPLPVGLLVGLVAVAPVVPLLAALVAAVVRLLVALMAATFVRHHRRWHHLIAVIPVAGHLKGPRKQHQHVSNYNSTLGLAHTATSTTSATRLGGGTCGGAD